MAYRLIPGGYIDETGPHRGVPPTQEDFDRIALLCAHRMMFAEEKIEFQPLNPLPQSDLRSMLEFTQEMPLEEAKKLWPNTKVPGEE